jgi:hypothetical protein
MGTECGLLSQSTDLPTHPQCGAASLVVRYPVAQHIVHASLPAGTGGFEIRYHLGVVARRAASPAIHAIILSTEYYEFNSYWRTV